MKYRILISILFPLLSSAQTPKSFTITGSIKGEDSGFVYIHYLNSVAPPLKKLDSALITHEKFILTDKVSYPTAVFLTTKQHDYKDYAYLYIEPGNMQFTAEKGKMNKALLTGSEANQQYKPYEAKIYSLLSSLEKSSPALSHRILDSVEIEEKKFIDEHPNSYVALNVLKDKATSLPFKDVETFYNRLPPQFQQTPAGKKIKEDLNILKSNLIGSRAHDFMRIDVNNKPLKLSDFRGRYVLIDFWASYCHPCRADNPHLRSLYAKYKDKGLEIIGVALDDGREDAWKEAIKKDSIGIWKHVLSGLGADKQPNSSNYPAKGSINYDYGLTSLYVKVLINPDGFIIGRYDYRSEGKDINALDKKLEEIFKN